MPGQLQSLSHVPQLHQRFPKGVAAAQLSAANKHAKSLLFLERHIKSQTNSLLQHYCTATINLLAPKANHNWYTVYA
jgi:hypothetical protein